MIDAKEFDRLIEQVFAEHKEINAPNCEQREKLRVLADFLLAENEKHNLTAIRTLEGVVKKHIFDSICIEKYIPVGAKIIDVGSGAGFPSLPLAVMRSDLSITPLDSTEKKVDHIKKAAELMGLENVTPIVGRAEELAKTTERRQSYDVAVARSVAALPVLSELCLPFVKIGGLFLSMKSASAAHEIEESKSAVKKLGGSPIEIVTLYNDPDDGDRCLFISKKKSQTPSDLPRRYAQIKKKSL